MSMIQVDIENECPNFPCPDNLTIKRWVMATLDQKMNKANVAIQIVDRNVMQTLNETYRQKAKPTNVLSFPSQLPEALRGSFLGDIAICAPVVQEEALKQNKSFDAHFAHLVIHGTLHLLGFDHVEENEALLMENEEIRILNILGYPDPYFVEITHD